MSALEQEIMEKFRQLKPAARQRVRAMIEQEIEAPSAFDYDTWFHDVELLRQQIRTSHSDELPPLDVIGMLRDIRDGEDE